MKHPKLWRAVSALFVLALLPFSTSKLRAQTSAALPLMPLPAHATTGDGQLLINSSFSVAIDGHSDPRINLGEERFVDKLSRETGIPFLPSSRTSQPTLTIRAAGAGDEVQKLGEDESYRLEVDSSHAQLTAPNPLGILHGLQTFLQLVHITPQGFAAPAVTIDDQPRFPWRGLMIDSGRHFMPIPVIERNLDGMETVKLNVFHWHLSDDQGFRVESKVFPLLQKKGSNGQYYTQEQIRHVIEYARDRGIRVVPEFDMPCHTSSWMPGYPELSSGPGPHSIATKWGVLDEAMDPTRESTYEFLDKFIGEMAALFPDAYFHIGGDECNGKEWDANPRIQAYMREHKLKDNAELQSYFSRRVQKIVAAHGKITMGWDEVLQPDTPRDVVIQSWRGQKSLAAAARRGNRGILSNGYYIDLNQPASEHYLVDPMSGDAASLSPEEKARILGGEATMWSEFVTPENVDSRIWPRTAAIAERFWSPQDVRDVDSMYARMAVVSQKLEFDRLTHQSFTHVMLQRMSGESDPEALKILAGVVQPPLGYQREDLRDYDTSSALNHLVDAVPPESEAAREFNQVAALIAAGNATAQQVQQARAWLTQWLDNDARIQPTLKKSELTAELISVSHTLSQVSSIGLSALDAIEQHQTVDSASVQSNMATLKAAEKPDAVLRDMIVPGIEALEQAAGKQ